MFTKSLRRISTLKDVLREKIPKQKQIINHMKKTYGNEIIDQVKLSQILSGSRGIKSIYWEQSILDEMKGIKIRGYSIPECQSLLPKLNEGGEIQPEGMFWLLMTGDIPSIEQVKLFQKEIMSRTYLSDEVEHFLKNIPRNIHPMNALSMGVMMCQNDSKFKISYDNKDNTNQHWENVYDDALNIIAKLPLIAASIFRKKYYNDYSPVIKNNDIDYSANFCSMMGFKKSNFHEYMRLYLSIHADHEGGNASAHASHLVSSTLADPYLSISSGINALAGPLHGSANSEVLKWILQLKELHHKSNIDITKESISRFVKSTIESGNVIPGYGHAVLKITDPRYDCQREFSLKHLPDDELFLIVDQLYHVVPDILSKYEKIRNPYPNVDSHSGIILRHYGLKQYEYYTVLFAVSRSMGLLSQMVWDRALNMPIERPKSINYEYLHNHFKKYLFHKLGYNLYR